MTLINILLANLIVSAGALLAIFTLGIKTPLLNKILKLLVALAAGTLLATTFFQLLPEAAHVTDSTSYLSHTLYAFIGFYLIEKIFHWRHCHETDCTEHSFGHMNLIGDAFHNFLDGIVIAGAFMTDFYLGVTTTLAIALHEIPQEIGDFGVLLYAGYSRAKAISANLLVAMTSLLGGLVGYFMFSYTQDLLLYLTPIAAGGFLYIATTDLLPELRKETQPKQVWITFTAFLFGIAIIAIGTRFMPHEHNSEEVHLEELLNYKNL